MYQVLHDGNREIRVVPVLEVLTVHPETNMQITITLYSNYCIEGTWYLLNIKGGVEK